MRVSNWGGHRADDGAIGPLMTVVASHDRDLIRGVGRPVALSPDRLRARTWTITGGYALIAIGWILLSDRALDLLVTQPDDLVWFGMVKGFAFVIVTAGLLFVLLRRTFGEVQRAYGVIATNEQELERIGRLYAALSRLNRAIARRPDRDGLFADTCRALVDQGGFAMVWIGWHDTENRRVVPVASHGGGTGFLPDVVVSTDEHPEGLGPSGRALRERQPVVCNDMLDDPALDPWRSTIERHPFRSIASLPIMSGDEAIAVLVVYAVEPSFFGTDEVALLRGATDDIAHALDVLAIDADRAEAEGAAEEERNFSDAMIDSMPGVLYFYDIAGRFLRWNRNFESESGWSADEIAEMHPLDFFEPADRPNVSEAIERVFEFGQGAVEADFLRRDGTRTPYFFTGRRVVFGDRTCLVGVGIDIADRRRDEAALRVLNDTLEFQVAERTDELRAALVRAEAADRLKSAFLATMSHELRTPLNSIIGFTGIVLQGLAGPLNDEQVKQLSMVRSSARHLLTLINDVLDISKIEAGQLEIRAAPFDLTDVAEQAAASIQPMAAAKGLELRTSVADDLASLVGDRRRIEQILLNLLSNAVKFTDEGHVELVVDRFSDPDIDPASNGLTGVTAVSLRVSDTGIGIAQDEQQYIFEPFRQLDSGLDRQHDGSGLGLTICHRLAELMGGWIDITSESSVGTEVIVVIPVEEQERRGDG